jgi:hypothetical protein
LQDNHATHAVTDRYDLTKPRLLDDVRNIVSIDRDRVRSRRLVALPVPPEVYGNDAMPPGEVFCLRGKERAIARRPVHAASPPRMPPASIRERLPNIVDGCTVGAGHFNQLEVPDQVNAMIEAFLRHYV